MLAFRVSAGLPGMRSWENTSWSWVIRWWPPCGGARAARTSRRSAPASPCGMASKGNTGVVSTVVPVHTQFAKQFLERGNKVVATVRRREGGTDLEALGAGVTVTQLDVTDPMSIATWADEVKAAAGGHVDVLINNAGWCHGPDLSRSSCSFQFWHQGRPPGGHVDVLIRVWRAVYAGYWAFVPLSQPHVGVLTAPGWCSNRRKFRNQVAGIPQWLHRR